MPLEIEAPYRFLGDLEVGDWVKVRQLMITLHNHISPMDQGINPCQFDAVLMTPLQKKCIHRMVREIMGSELLEEMVIWFNSRYDKDKHTILRAVEVLREHATWFVRNPSIYTAEYAVAKEKWAQFIAPGRGEIDGQDYRKGGEVMSIDSILNSPTSSPANTLPRKAKMNVMYKEKRYSSDEDATATSSDESINLFKETVITGLKRTRSGNYTR